MKSKGSVFGKISFHVICKMYFEEQRNRVNDQDSGRCHGSLCGTCDILVMAVMDACICGP